jgi:beta-N-acetylhexosaminidase
VNTSKNELEMFNVAFNSNVDAVMVGHAIIYGDLDSNGNQATISNEIIDNLKKDFNGLIITDAMTMVCLSSSYLFNFKKVYPDLILAGNDIILDTHKFSNYRQIKRRINYLAKEAEKNPELMKRIDESVKKVLEKKGYEFL